MARKLALLIGNSEYQDQTLARLKTPDADVGALARVLRDPQIGGFDKVTRLVNETEAMLRRAIARFLIQKRPDDLLLLYFTGHGVLDDQGHLYLAAKDTEHDLPSSSAIPATFITNEMNRSRSRRQVLILDCCYSGAFARGAKGPGTDIKTAPAFEGTGYGRWVLTATDATQYAWEGDKVIGGSEHSVFTHYLVQGFRTGEADADNDGQITLDELYDYVFKQVVAQTPKQKPGKWSYEEQGDIVIARNPHLVVKPVELPVELQQAIESPLAEVRAGAVRVLNGLLLGSDTGVALTAQEALRRLADDDSRRVSTAATEGLAAYAETQRGDKAESEVKQTAAEKTAPERMPTEQPATQRPAVEFLKVERTEWVLWLKWVLATTLGGAVGGWTVGAAVGLVGTGGIVREVMSGAVFGAAVGVPQWLVLRRQITQAGWWVLATTLGGAVGGTVLGAVGGPGVHEAMFGPVFGAVFGGVVGVLQWLVLRRQITQAGWWVLATTLGGAVGWALDWAEAGAGALDWAGAGARGGVITGAVLVWLLRHPTPARS